MTKITIEIEDPTRAEELIAVISQLSYVKEIRISDNQAELNSDLSLSSIGVKKAAYQEVSDIWDIAAQFPPDKKWTFDDLQSYFPKDLKIKLEIIHGELFIQEYSENYILYQQNQLPDIPGPSKLHQRISRKLSYQMSDFAENHNLGEIFYAPFDVKLDEEHVFQPDILLVAKVHSERLKDTYLEGAPDLVVEILSSANYKAERDKKHELYESFGVSEYWLIYPQKRKITVEVPREGKFQLFSEAEQNGTIKSFLLEGFEITLEEILGKDEN